MTRYILRRLKATWQGPRIKLVVGHQTVELGAGALQAILIFKKPSIFRRMVLNPSLAFGEGYMNGDIVIEGDLQALLNGFFQSTELTPAPVLWARRQLRRLPNSVTAGVANAQHHYDISNNFYELWLDPSRTYSCAYFATGTESLAQAQETKRDIICRKLRLQKGHTLLDIGCGWGALLFHAAEKYGVSGLGITPAKQQADYVRQEAERRGLVDKVRIIEGDWRTLPPKKFDRVVSVGMFEHVGHPHYRAFLRRWQELLIDDGISLLHTIGGRGSGTDPWIRKYIFPGGSLPTLSEISEAAAAAGLHTYRVENWRPHYARTLHAWSEKFDAVRPHVTSMFDEQFVRMWWLYLKSCETAFQCNALDLWQIELYGPKATLPLRRTLMPTINV